MLSAFANSFKIPDLRQRILFTLGLIFSCRIVANVPTPGVDPAALQRVIAEIESTVGGGFLGLIDMFSGGALRNVAVGALGIMPYISASIIMQLMGTVVPVLERLKREGEAGQQKITQYTRYLTLGLCVVQGLFMAMTLENPAALGIGHSLVLHPGMSFRIMTIITMTAGTMLLMWLGEQITERGIGNGISLIITISIISRLPHAVYAVWSLMTGAEGTGTFGVFELVFIILLLLMVVAGTVFVTQGQRKIPVQYAKRVIGRRVYGGQSTYLPLRINYAGVMPIIFAQAILMFPAPLLNRLPGTFFAELANLLHMESWFYMFLFGLMILFFSYFWVATQFDPVRIADDLKKYGGYIPGIRPGRTTANYLDHTMTRITLAGAVFLTIIAVIPTLMVRLFGVPWMISSFFGGTSLLIIVGVMLDTMRQVESQLLMRHYDGFLKKGKLRGRGRNY